MTNKKWLCLIPLCVILTATPGCESQKVVVVQGDAPLAPGTDHFRPIHLEVYWPNNDLTLAVGERIEKVWLEPKSLYCLTNLNILYRLDREKGIITWAKHPTSPPRVVRRPAETADKTLVIAHDVVYVYELESGNPLQELRLGFAVNSDPAFDGQRLFVADSVDRLVAIELATGVKMWTARTGKAISVQPVWLDRLVVAASESGEVLGYDVEWGNSLWSEHFQTRAAILSRPVLTEQTCYVASTDSMLYCLRSASGDELWRYFAGRSLPSSPVVTGGRVFLSVPSKGLVALDARDGTELKDFQFTDGKQYVGTVNDRLYILLEGDKIVSVDAQTGERLAEVGVKGFDFFLGDDSKPHIYLVSSRGQIACLGQLGLGLKER